MTSPSIQQRGENSSNNKQPLFPDSHKRLIPVVDPENPVSCDLCMFISIFEGRYSDGPSDHRLMPAKASGRGPSALSSFLYLILTISPFFFISTVWKYRIQATAPSLCSVAPRNPPDTNELPPRSRTGHLCVPHRCRR